MKANELTIGDLILAQFMNGDRYARIAAIAIDCAVVNVSDREYEHEYDSIFPIPLTAETLKKNGFIKTNNDTWDAYVKRVKECGTFDIYVDLTFNEIDISKVDGAGTDCEECDYASEIYLGHALNVHELQHALRLYGLNELADKFKV